MAKKIESKEIKKKNSSNTEPVHRKASELRDDMIAMSRAFSDALCSKNCKALEWSLLQRKLLHYAISKINWRDSDIKKYDNLKVVINNREAMKDLGWNTDTNSFTKMMLENFDAMTNTGNITIRNIDTGEWFTSSIIVNAKGYYGTTVITFDAEILPYLEKLYDLPSYNAHRKIQRNRLSFYSIPKYDYFNTESKFGCPLVDELIRCTNGSKKIHHKIPIDKYYSLCGLPKDAYYSEGKDGYVRWNKTMFVKRVVKEGIKDIIKMECIELYPYEDGEYFKFIYEGRVVTHIEFYYRVRSEKEIYNRRLIKEKEVSVKQQIIDTVGESINDGNYKKEIIFEEYDDVYEDYCCNENFMEGDKELNEYSN